MATTKTPKIPKSLAECADLYYTTRETRLKLEREAKASADFESSLKEHLINNIPKSNATGVAGKLCRVSIGTKAVPQVEDWEKFYAYVAKNKSKGGFAFLNKAVNTAAVKEVWDAGKTIPGVAKFNAVVMSVNKL